MQIMATNKKYPAAGGGGAYAPDAVVFTTGDRLTRTGAITGMDDATTHTMSFWWYCNSSGNGAFWFGSYTTGLSENFVIIVNQSGGMTLVLNGTADYNESIANGTCTVNAWNHVLWARTGTTSKLYVNDGVVSVGAAGANATNFASDSWCVGARTGGSLDTNLHEFSEVWLTTEYIDIATTSNRRKFISATGKPVDLGSDGSTPTGTAAPIYLKGPASTWNSGTNSGSGENFTVTGTFTDSSNEPVET